MPTTTTPEQYLVIVEGEMFVFTLVQLGRHFASSARAEEQPYDEIKTLVDDALVPVEVVSHVGTFDSDDYAIVTVALTPKAGRPLPTATVKYTIDGRV